MPQYQGGPILGIDQNSNCGLCQGLPGGGTPKLETIKLRHDPTDTADDIFHHTTYYFAERFRIDCPGAVAVEKLIPDRRLKGETNHQRAIITAGIYAIIVGIAKCKGIPVVDVASQTWRAMFLGNGRMPSDKAKRAAVLVCRRLGWDPSDHNAAEAGGIFFWAVAHFAPWGMRTLRPALFAGDAP